MFTFCALLQRLFKWDIMDCGNLMQFFLLRIFYHFNSWGFWFWKNFSVSGFRSPWKFLSQFIELYFEFSLCIRTKIFHCTKYYNVWARMEIWDYTKYTTYKHTHIHRVNSVINHVWVYLSIWMRYIEQKIQIHPFIFCVANYLWTIQSINWGSPRVFIVHNNRSTISRATINRTRLLW